MRILATIGMFGLSMAIVVSASSSARAEPPNSSSGLTLTECPADLAGPLPKSLALELQGVVDLDPTRAPALSVLCTDKQVVASASFAGETLERRYDLAKLDGEGSARLLAITLAELRTALMEKSTPVEKPVPTIQIIVAEPPKSDEQSPTAISDDRAVSAKSRAHNLAVSTSGRIFADGLWLWGPQIQGEIEPCPSCVLRWIVGGEWSTSQNFSIGDVDAALFNGGIDFGYLWGHAPWTLSALAGLRLGSARFTAKPDAGSSSRDHQALWGGPAVTLGAGYALAPQWAIIFNLEAGYTLWSVKAVVEGQDTVGAVGAWISPAIGLQYSFSAQ